MGMPLPDYLNEHDLTFAEFGRVINASRMTVRRWTLPEGNPSRNLPSPDMMVKIYVGTSGEVEPNDWYDLPDLTPPANAETAAPEEVAA